MREHFDNAQKIISSRRQNCANTDYSLAIQMNRHYDDYC